MKPAFLIILLKELKEALRDRRALLILVALVITYPSMLGYMLKHQIDRSTKPEREGIELTVIGAAQAPTLMAQFKQHNVTVTESEPLSDDAITELLHGHKVVAVLRLSEKFSASYQSMRPAPVELWFDSAAENGSRKRDIEDVLGEYSSSIAGARLLAHGVSPVTMRPIDLQRYDVGSSASRSANIIGAALGMLFFPVFIFSLSTAIDSTAGERERRSLEVLLAQPASVFDIVFGKWLAATALSAIGLSLMLMFAQQVLHALPLEEIGLAWRMSWGDMVVICFASLPLAMTAAAVQIALAMNAKSFKEAQTMVSLATVAAMVPGVVVSIMELKTASWMYLVPMLSNQTLARELSKGQSIGALPFVLTIGSGLLCAALALGFACWRMKSERYILSV